VSAESTAPKALPARPHLDWYRKSAKKKLKLLRASNPRAKLADAQLAIAREYGFASWRKLSVSIASGSVNLPHAFRDVMKTILAREVEALRTLLASAPQIVNRTGPHPMWGGRPQPLHVAIESGNDEAFRLLLDAGADVNGDNSEYDLWSPLMLAVHWNRELMRDELLRRGATIGLIEALMLGDDARVMAILRKDSSAISRLMPNNATPLHFARTIPSARRMLDAGVELDAKDKYGQTPVQRLAGKGAAHRRLVRFLISRGAVAEPRTLAAVGDLAALKSKPKRDVRHAEVLHAAVEAGHRRVMRWLLDHGAKVNARTSRGSKATPLHAAAWNGDLPMVKLLLSRGADPRAIDREHKTTPAVWARTALARVHRKSCQAVADYLDAIRTDRASSRARRAHARRD
jgi:ankyrin repeat protein